MAMPMTAVLRLTDTVGKLVRRSRRDDAQEAESIEETALADYHKELVSLFGESEEVTEILVIIRKWMNGL